MKLLLTKEQIERGAGMRFAVLDDRLMHRKISQEAYDEAASEISAWADWNHRIRAAYARLYGTVP